MEKKKITNLLIVTFLLCGCAITKAQDGKTLGKYITQDRVSIFNNSQYKLSFFLGVKKYTVNAQKVFLSSALSASPTIKVETKGKWIEYQLKLGEAYMIYWSEQKIIWDVKKIIPRNIIN